MSQRAPSEWLTWICSSKSLDELVDNYDQWANTYDSETRVWKPVPLAVAMMLNEHAENKQAAVLDIGAGTGFVGAALNELGFEKIVGIDISPQMLSKAAEKAVYSGLYCCAIGDEQFKVLGKAASIVAGGVFAKGHAGPAELNAIQESIEPGGVFVCTARQSFLPNLQTVFDRPQWELIDSKVMPIYKDDPTHVLAYKIHNNI